MKFKQLLSYRGRHIVFPLSWFLYKNDFLSEAWQNEINIDILNSYTTKSKSNAGSLPPVSCLPHTLKCKNTEAYLLLLCCTIKPTVPAAITNRLQSYNHPLHLPSSWPCGFQLWCLQRAGGAENLWKDPEDLWKHLLSCERSWYQQVNRHVSGLLCWSPALSAKGHMCIFMMDIMLF